MEVKERASTTKVIIGGISVLALAAIPAALALGATGWLGFTITAHGFQRTLQQERRRAVYVASPEPQRAPMAFDIRNAGPVVVDRADLDAEKLTVYLRNRSRERQCFQRLHWALKSPDGTLISSGDEFIGDADGGLQPGDKIEGQLDVKQDQRAVSLRLFATAQTACG